MLRACLLALCLFFMSVSSAGAAGRTIVVAHDATWPPMEFMNEKREIVGYSVDYIDAVAKEAGFTVEHRNVAWDGIFAGLAGKKYDVVSSSVTITDERAKVMDFSTPYYEVRQAVIVPKDSTARNIDDLKGKKLGAQIGTTGYMAIKKAKGSTALTYDEIGLAMSALASGRLDGVVCDDPVATNYILENAEYAKKMKVAFIIPADVPEYYGFAVAKGNKEVLDLLNKGIAVVKAKGIEEQLRKKWIGQ
jgi:polar amino acid transport system substrate-binding protein